MQWRLAAATCLCFACFAQTGPLEEGRTAYLQGRYAQAEQHLLAAVAAAPEDPSALRLLTDLYRAQGRYAEAEPVLSGLLQSREKSEGSSLFRDESFAEDLTSFATLLRNQTRAAEARGHLQRALSIYERVHGLTHPKVAEGIKELAATFVDVQQFTQAIALYKQSLTILETALHPGHPDLLPTLDELGSLYRNESRYTEAEPLFARALTIRERTDGPVSPELIPTLDNLAYVLFGQQKFTEAAPLYNRLLALWQKNAGLDHPMVALTLEKMAEFEAARNDLDAAECLALQSLQIRTSALTDSLKRLGRIRVAQGTPDRSTQAAEQVADLVVSASQED